jgi:hypothetical protein
VAFKFESQNVHGSAKEHVVVCLALGLCLGSKELDYFSFALEWHINKGSDTTFFFYSSMPKDITFLNHLVPFIEPQDVGYTKTYLLWSS